MTEVPLTDAPPPPLGPLAEAENLLLALALLAMVAIPVSETILRTAGSAGISGASTIVQHLTLVVSMIGAAVAAREGRLLSLATVTFLKGKTRAAARLFSGFFAATITAFLAIASARFVLSEREGDNMLAGIPVWIVQAILPLGFAVIALRLVWHAAESWRGRLAATVLAAGLALLAFQIPIAPDRLMLPSLTLLALAAIFGAPIFVVLGGAALILFWGAEVPIAALSIDHYSLVVNPSLPAIPLFTLAGYLLAEGGSSKRLVRLFDAFVGQFRGGPAIVTALACAFFTAFTGGSGVTILALGGLLMPVLLSARYSARTSLGLLTGAGSLGILFPPCLPLILYANVAQVPMKEMFLGGILPGTLLLVLTAWWGVRQSDRSVVGRKFDRAEAGRALWDAKWEALLPVVVLAALFSGFATPVEAAAFTALYALVIEALIYRDFKSFRKLTHVFTECGLLVGGVLLILGVALGFTNYLIDAEIPTRGVDWTTASIDSKLVFLLLLNLFLLVVGCLMDIFSAIIVVVPLIVPIGLAFGIDPVHLGIIFLANLELGYLTPPVGMNLFISSYRFNKPIGEVYRASFPILLVLLAGVLLITYIPPITTFLPRLLGR